MLTLNCQAWTMMLKRNHSFRYTLVVCGVILTLLLQVPLYARERDAKDGVNGLVPGGIVSVDGKYCVVIEKATQKLYLYRIDNGTIQCIKEFSCSTGQNHGDKLKSGDKKTPEGIYYVKRIFRDDQLEPRYGVMAFVLDFPNFLDEREDKGGNGIWIHGLDRPLLPYDSKGCIALNNEDIKQLSPYIRLFSTPVLIEEKIEYRSMQHAVAERLSVERFLQKWELSWEGKNLDSFMSCYSPEKFRDWKGYRENKRSINKRYKFIDVAVDNINIVKHDKTIIVSFLQDYESNEFMSFGHKKLFLEKNSNDLHIIGERWARVPFLNPIKDSKISEQRRVRRFLNTWSASWEQKNSTTYMSCYSRDFHSQNMNRDQWKRYKDEINRQNKTVTVFVEKPKITIHNDRATVTYIQKYISDSYTDYGLKRLSLQKEKGVWKIIEEQWEHL